MRSSINQSGSLLEFESQTALSSLMRLSFYLLLSMLRVLYLLDVVFTLSDSHLSEFGKCLEPIMLLQSLYIKFFFFYHQADLEKVKKDLDKHHYA